MDRTQVQVLLPNLYIPYPQKLVVLFGSDDNRASSIVEKICDAILDHTVRGGKPFSNVIELEDGLDVKLTHDTNPLHIVRLVDDIKVIVAKVLTEHE